MAARGMLPSGEERPAGSSRAPVGRRAAELRDAGGLEEGAFAGAEARLQLAKRSDASIAMLVRCARCDVIAE
jgi:hypothetical protein